MTVPIDYKQASADFDRFMLDLRDALELGTAHPAWGALLGLFETFRRRLSVKDTLLFAKALPPLLRAVFIQDWNDAQPSPYADRSTLEREVKAYHRDHQLAPPSSIALTASVLWRHSDRAALTAALSELPDGTREFWTPAPEQ